MGDSLINERKVHVETVKALFYRQNPHENVSWKATVYSLDLNYSVHKVNYTRTNSLGIQLAFVFYTVTRYTNY